MACGGFTCSKNALCALNILYILVGILLIVVSVYSRTSNKITSVAIISGIIACGVFLMILAVIGLIGAAKHHQVLLFFYMTILFILFLVQFIIALACLAVTDEQQRSLLRTGWRSTGNDTRLSVQASFDCCGFETQTWNQSAGETRPTDADFHPPCGTTAHLKAQCCIDDDNASPCCNGDYSGVPVTNQSTPCPCVTCYAKLKQDVDKGLHASGGIGLFFSFTEFIGVIIAAKFRNLKDPGADPKQLFL